VAAQVYISEISHPSIRASLCSAAKVFSQLGLLAAYIMGAWYVFIFFITDKEAK
jgi:hypothetical protein